MIKRNGYFLAAILFSLSFTSACSKNLMPPGGLGSQMSGTNESSSGSSGNAGRGFGIQERNEGFVSEENVGESARSGEFGSSGPEGGSAERFKSEPFLGDDLRSDGFEEARNRQDFKPSPNIQDINFKFDKYDLDDKSRSTLRQNASYLKSNSATVIEIQGHCDERGTNNYNLALGERRAHATKMYLVQQGISSRRIHTISYGEERPSCFDGNDACWFKNRRAHFRISE
jgi:peptidoglycan-associated lipoprotein